MARHTVKHRVDSRSGVARRQRVVALRDLVSQRAYEVSAEDVAASIIRDAIVVAAPATRLPH